MCREREREKEWQKINERLSFGYKSIKAYNACTCTHTGNVFYIYL